MALSTISTYNLALPPSGTRAQTEKRYSYNVHKDSIECDGNFVAYVNRINGVSIKNKLNELWEENEELKKVLGAILLEVKKDISNTNQTGEIKAFINPNSFELISEVLKKYGALKGWYDE